MRAEKQKSFKYLKPHLPFILLALLFTTFRVVQLYCCRHVAHPEEAVLGLFIKHVIEGDSPVTLSNYFLSYSGGSLISCLLSLPLCKMFGVSILSLRWCSFLHSAAILLLLYCFVRRFWGGTAAIFAALFYVLSPPSYSHYTSLFLSGEYLVIFLDIGLMYILLAMFVPQGGCGERKRMFLTAALGFGSGLAVYFLFSSVLFAVLAFGTWLMLRGRSLRRGELLLYGTFLLLGLLPYFYFSFLYPEQSRLFLGSLLEAPAGLAQKIRWFFPFLVSEFTRSFHFEFFGYYPGRACWNYIYVLIFCGAWLHLIWVNRSFFQSMTTVLFLKGKEKLGAPSDVRPESPLLLLPVLFIVACFFSAYCRPPFFHYRYFFPLYPMFQIFCAVSLSSLFSGKGRAVKACALAVVSFIVLISWRGVTGIAGKQDFWESYPLPETISRLKEKGIEYVYTEYFLKWQILFESGEEIIASCEGMPFFYFSDFEGVSDSRVYGSPYRLGEKVVDNAVRQGVSYAYLFRLDPRLPYYGMLKNYLSAAGVEYQMETFGNELVLFYGFGRPVTPAQAGLESGMKKYLRTNGER